MSQALDDISRDPSPYAVQFSNTSAIFNRHISASLLLSADVVLSPGAATIPLNGIDVPFHSTFLRNGISPYRKFLESKLVEENINIDKLIGRFIPNLIGKPFSLEREYVEEVASITGSEYLLEMLRNVSLLIKGAHVELYC
jgi:fatty acid synthase subunit beta